MLRAVIGVVGVGWTQAGGTYPLSGGAGEDGCTEAAATGCFGEDAGFCCPVGCAAGAGWLLAGDVVASDLAAGLVLAVSLFGVEPSVISALAGALLSTASGNLSLLVIAAAVTPIARAQTLAIGKIINAGNPKSADDTAPLAFVSLLSKFIGKESIPAELAIRLIVR